jgi:uncharacterized protein YecT (DUF1311 family)
MRVAACGLLAILLLPLPAPAQSQAEMAAEARADLRKIEAEAKTVYDQLAAKVSPEGRTALKSSERAWRKYRDAQCKFDTLGRTGGSVYPMVLSLCQANLTRQWKDQLAAQLNCEEGDLSCGGQ